MILAISEHLFVELVFTPIALKQLKSIQKADARRIGAAMQEVAARYPQRMAYVTEIVGRPGYWRAKKGDYRAIFTIANETITVIEIGHRKEIYQ
jgi:mRNA-degrading endonuclease RelE of RelBE toxin-antitoxin system